MWENEIQVPVKITSQHRFGPGFPVSQRKALNPGLAAIPIIFSSYFPMEKEKLKGLGFGSV